MWTATEEPGPVDTTDSVLALPAPGWLIHSTASDGIVRLVNHGTDRLPPPPATDDDSPHYAKLAYSTATAPETPLGPDNHLALLAPDGTPSPRGRIHPLRCEGRTAASWHEALGRRVETVSVVHGPWEIRVHRIPGDNTPVREGGWAVADDTAPPAAESGPGRALARRADGLTSALVGLYGWGEAAGTVVAAEDTNAYGRYSATPVLDGTGPLLVTLVMLGTAPHTGASAHVDGDGGVQVRFPDGVSERVAP